MGKKVAILQSNYIPWKGYFDLMNMVDNFVILDEVQFTKNDWRNRNQIKTPQGLQWLTVPVEQKSLHQTIISTKVAGSWWSMKHWKTIEQNYVKTPFFSDHRDELFDIYNGLKQEEHLSNINMKLIFYVKEQLGIDTEIMDSRSFEKSEDKSQRLIDICKQQDASIYVSGPAARGYLDTALFKRNNIIVEWMNYSSYSEYRQPYGTFEHGVTVLDLIFNEGPDANKFMKSFSAVK